MLRHFTINHALAFFTLGASAVALTPPPALSSPVELLANPGLEEPYAAVGNTNSSGIVTGLLPSGWADNSRYSGTHTANTYAPETNDTVSGKALRADIAVQPGYGSGANFELYQPFLAVTQRSYTAAVWLKGSAGATASLTLRLKSAPYTVRAATNCAVTTGWRSFSLTAQAVTTETWVVSVSLSSQPLTLWLDEAGCQVQDGHRQWFVATDGSDANSGSLSSPFLTFARAITNLNAGDILCLRGGTYRETLQLTQGGTPADPVTVTAYNAEPVTISGCDALAGAWSATSNGIFETAAGWTLGPGYNQVFVDGAMQHEARHPDHGYADLLSPATVALSVSSNYAVTCSAFAGKGDLAGARFYASVGSSWSWQTALVASNTAGTLFLKPATASTWWWPNYANKSSDTGRGFLYGLPALLDADGEWLLLTNAAAPHALHLRIAGGADPTGHLVELKRRAWCIDINGQKNIAVSNLTLRAGAVRLNGDNLVLHGCDARHLSHYLTFTSGGSANGGRTEGGGIVVSGTSNTVCACTLSDTAGSGILVSGSGHLITRNHIYNTDYSATYATGMTLSGTDNTATFNTVHDSGRDLVQPTGKGIRLLYNDVYHAGRLCKDLGAVYAWGTNAQTTNGAVSRIAYNWVHDSTTNDALGMGIYIDNYSRNFQIDHNVVWNFGDAAALKWSDGLRLNSPADGIRLFHNTLFRCRNYDYSTYTPYYPTNSFPDKAYWTNNNHHLFYIAHNNLYMTNAPTELVNAESRDFRPSPGSLAVDPPFATNTIAWTTTNGVLNVPSNYKLSMTYKYQPFSFEEQGGVGVAADTDGDGFPDPFTGTTPDSGAYEAGAPYWVPGVSGWSLECPGVRAEPPYDTVAAVATARGTLISPGTAPAAVYLHWGSGGSPSAWTNVLCLGTAFTQTFQPLLANLTGIQPDTLYGYRFRASNASGESWSDPLTFTAGSGLPVSSTWDAGAGTNQSLSAAANWEADAAPDFNGALRPTFASAGAIALVDRAVSLYGLTFNRSGNFALAGSSAVTLRAGGISAALPSATSRTYTLAADLLLADQQTWFVTNSGAATATLDVTGRVSDGTVACGLTKTGDGTLSLRSANTYSGVTIVSNGLLAIAHPGALGAASAGTVVRSVSGGRLQLGGGITVAEPLTLNGERAGSGYSLYNSDGSNVWSGALTRIGQTRISVASGSTLTMTGGAAGGGGLYVANSSGTLIIAGKPLLIGGDTFWADSGGLTVLSAASNVWGETVLGRGTLRMGAARALPAATKLKVGLNYAAGGTLDLNGFDQTVGQLLHNTQTAGVRVVTSPSPATLTVSQSADTAFDGNLTGAVRLVKTGAGALTLSGTNLLTSGGLVVSNGTLAVTAAASLGSGSLALGGGTFRNGRPAAGAFGASNLVWDAGGALGLTLAADGSAGRIALSGAFSRGAGSAFLFDFAGTGVRDKTYTLVTFSNTTFQASDFRCRNLGSSPGPTLQGVFAIQSNALTLRTLVQSATVLLLR